MVEYIYPILILLILATLIVFRIFNVQFDFDNDYMYVWYTYKRKRIYKQFKL